MLDEVPAIICVENHSDQAILGRLRDGRSRVVMVTAANGQSLSAREPFWQTPLARVAPGETGCVEGLTSTLERPVLNLWTTRPSHVLFNGREDFTDCRLPRPLSAGVRLTYAYTPSAVGAACRVKEDR